MLFRVLVMIAVLLGIWIGFGAPIGGVGISRVKPDPRIKTFEETIRELEDADPEEYEAEQTRLCELHPQTAWGCDNEPDDRSQEAPALD